MSKTSETSDINYKFKIVSGKNYVLTNDEKFANQFLQSRTTQMQTQKMPKKRGPYKKRRGQAEPEVRSTQKTRKVKTVAPLTQ